MSESGYRSFELFAVLVTALGKFLFYDILDQRLIFILIMFAFWGSYVYRRIQNDSGIPLKWGFRVDNFKQVFRKVFPFGLVITLTCIGLGSYRGTINPHWHIIPILIVYPLFGILQQFLLMSLVAGNIQASQKLKKPAIILITSILFGALHYPYYWLIIGTFILSLLYTFIFLQQRNLIVLGIFHGWLGAIFYYTVVDKDPFLEVFGPILN